MQNKDEEQPPVAPSTTKPPVSSSRSEPENEPNIQFVGKVDVIDKETGKVTKELVPAEDVPRWRRDGMTQFRLPEGQEQLDGFYHKEAALLIRAFRDFKPLVSKGDK